MKQVYTRIRQIILGILVLSATSVKAQTWGNTDPHLVPLSQSLRNGMFSEAPYTHCATHEGRLYFTDYFGLHIYDINDPANPVPYGSVPVPGKATSFTIQGSYAYVCNGMGIAVVNIANPSAPFVAEVSFLSYQPYQVIVDGTTAFVAANDALYSYTMPDPEHFTPSDNISLAPGNILMAGMVKYGSNIYYVNQSNLYGVDASDPANLQQICSIPLASGGACWGNIALNGQFIYVVTTLKFQVYDLANPVSPALVYNSLPTPHTVFDLALDGNLLVLSHQNNESWTILDVSTPAAPVTVYTSSSPSLHGLYSMGTLKDNILYIMDNGQSGYQGTTLHLVDLSSPTTPSETATIASLPGRTKSLALFTDNDAEYALAGQDNDFDTESATGLLRVVNVSDPANPVLVSTLETPSGMVSVAHDGQHTAFACLAEYNFPYYSFSIAVINLDNLSNPYISSITPLGGFNLSKQVNSNILYFDGKLFVVTIGELIIFTESGGMLTQVGSTSLYGQHGFAAYGNIPGYVYIAGGANGILLYNVSNPASAFMVNFFDTPGTCWDVYASDGIAYVADYTHGFGVFDVSQNMIVPLTQTACAGKAISVAVFDQIAYVGLEDGRIQKFDVSDPSFPQSLGWYLTEGGRVNDLAVDGGNYRLYVSNELDMNILQLGEPVGGTTLLALTDDFLVYPNPGTNPVTVELDLARPGRVALKLFDTRGELVWSMPERSLQPGMNRIRVSTGELAEGVYTLQLRTAETCRSRKIVVNH